MNDYVSQRKLRSKSFFFLWPFLLFSFHRAAPVSPPRLQLHQRGVDDGAREHGLGLWCGDDLLATGPTIGRRTNQRIRQTNQISDRIGRPAAASSPVAQQVHCLTASLTPFGNGARGGACSRHEAAIGMVVQIRRADGRAAAAAAAAPPFARSPVSHPFVVTAADSTSHVSAATRAPI